MATISSSLKILPILHTNTNTNSNSNSNSNKTDIKLKHKYYSNVIVKQDNLFTLKTRLHPVFATALTVPSSVPDKASIGKSPRWSARAIKSFAMAEIEARKLKYPNTGTEALLMGILIEGTSIASKTLRASGVTLFKVREETVKLLGKSDMYFFSPEHPPLTEQAQRALDWGVQEKLKSGEDGEVTASHFLLGIWSEKESAGHKLMESLGFNDEKAQELAKTMDKDIILSFK